jgi:CRISPR-associated DxTHG motif protein
MIILTMLGVTKYEHTMYTWAEQNPPAIPAPFFPIALHQWFPEAEIKVLVTQEARDKHGETIKQHAPNAQLIDIQTDDPWSIYRAIAEHIPEKAEVILDITHGFRSLPMLALLSIAFLRPAKGVQLKHLVYGAFEAKTPEGTPVFDLTPLVTMLDWANATNRFLETGDARKLKPLIRMQRRAPLNSLADKLSDLSTAMATHRIEATHDMAEKVIKEINQIQQEPWEAQHEPMKMLLDQIHDNTTALVADSKNPIQALKAQFALIKQYMHHGQFVSGIGLAREWIVSFRIWNTRGIASSNHEIRMEAETWLGEQLQHVEAQQITNIAPEWQDLIQAWQKISQCRNDVLHFGMNEQALGVRAIEQRIQNAIDGILESIEPFQSQIFNDVANP